MFCAGFEDPAPLLVFAYWNCLVERIVDEPARL